MSNHPVLLHTAIDARDRRALAEFSCELLGLRYRDGEEPPIDRTLDEALLSKRRSIGSLYTWESRSRSAHVDMHFDMP